MKFDVGQTVYSRVEVRGSYEPTRCKAGTRLKVTEIHGTCNGAEYICGYDGYKFKEDQLESVKEHAERILKDG